MLAWQGGSKRRRLQGRQFKSDGSLARKPRGNRGVRHDNLAATASQLAPALAPAHIYATSNNFISRSVPVPSLDMIALAIPANVAAQAGRSHSATMAPAHAERCAHLPVSPEDYSDDPDQPHLPSAALKRRKDEALRHVDGHAQARSGSSRLGAEADWSACCGTGAAIAVAAPTADNAQQPQSLLQADPSTARLVQPAPKALAPPPRRHVAPQRHALASLDLLVLGVPQ